MHRLGYKSDTVGTTLLSAHVTFAIAQGQTVAFLLSLVVQHTTKIVSKDKTYMKILFILPRLK